MNLWTCNNYIKPWLGHYVNKRSIIWHTRCNKLDNLGLLWEDFCQNIFIFVHYENKCYYHQIIFLLRIFVQCSPTKQWHNCHIIFYDVFFLMNNNIDNVMRWDYPKEWFGEHRLHNSIFFVTSYIYFYISNGFFSCIHKTPKIGDCKK